MVQTSNLDNLVYWTYFDSGYGSLPTMTASSGRMTDELLLSYDRDWLVMTCYRSLRRRPW